MFPKFDNNDSCVHINLKFNKSRQTWWNDSDIESSPMIILEILETYSMNVYNVYNVYIVYNEYYITIHESRLMWGHPAVHTFPVRSKVQAPPIFLVIAEITQLEQKYQCKTYPTLKVMVKHSNPNFTFSKTTLEFKVSSTNMWTICPNWSKTALEKG